MNLFLYLFQKTLTNFVYGALWEKIKLNLFPSGHRTLMQRNEHLRSFLVKKLRSYEFHTNKIDDLCFWMKLKLVYKTKLQTRQQSTHHTQACHSDYDKCVQKFAKKKLTSYFHASWFIPISTWRTKKQSTYHVYKQIEIHSTFMWVIIWIVAEGKRFHDDM